MILEVGNTWGLLDREVTARTGESVQWCEFECGRTWCLRALEEGIEHA